MTTCSSSSDDPDCSSTSDVEDNIDQSATDKISLGHVQETVDLVNRSWSKLKTANGHCECDE